MQSVEAIIFIKHSSETFLGYKPHQYGLFTKQQHARAETSSHMECLISNWFLEITICEGLHEEDEEEM